MLWFSGILLALLAAIAVLDRAGRPSEQRDDRRAYARSDGSVLAPQSSTTTRSPGAGR